ncbi:1-acyl-sn-glycerol-3-phosphate acyltransferase [Sphingobacterium corticis]|uniref:1-acyl-sn-glycerol-3-phosphate acyltransferase n=1 Tax=Sphingobacterium corticis TaxID=1812823 RepID=A0ABW5NM87_9SPHI
MESLEQEKFIEVRNVIHKKSPKLARWIPKPIISYLRRIIHEDDINYIMQRYQDDFGLDFVDSLLKELGVEVVLEGAENVPLTDSVIFASNHPLGGLDGVAFMQAIGRYRKDVKFLVNDILLNIRNLEPLFVPVNKIGNQSKNGIAAIENAYASDQALLVFPAGLVSRKIDGKIQDLEWKKSFVTKAKKYKKDIVPVYIDGKNSNFFYNLARLRQKVGIKANLEMLYLPDEMFSQRNQRVKICIGKRIPYTSFDASKNERAWAAEVRRVVYDMALSKK